MSQFLPYKDLKFEEEIDLSRILATADESHTGYIVECDLRFPKHLHDKFKEFPPCPETLKPDMSWFSDYQKKVGKKTGIIK